MDTSRAPYTESQADPRPADICVMAERLDGTLRTCEALLQAARAVDLIGLDTAAGRLCAAILDLPPAAGARWRAPLEALRTRLDGIELMFRGGGAAP